MAEFFGEPSSKAEFLLPFPLPSGAPLRFDMHGFEEPGG
jgi:hypothetical protein